jgi:hypothetical protein
MISTAGVAIEGLLLLDLALFWVLVLIHNKSAGFLYCSRHADCSDLLGV